MDDRGSMGKSTIRDDSGAISKRAISNRAVIVVRIGVGRAKGLTMLPMTPG